MTMTCDALALSYANVGYSSFGTDLAHLASDPFDLAHLASTATFGSPSDDEDEDEDEDESTA
jgi:hypothetical protein